MPNTFNSATSSIWNDAAAFRQELTERVARAAAKSFHQIRAQAASGMICLCLPWIPLMYAAANLMARAFITLSARLANLGRAA